MPQQNPEKKIDPVKITPNTNANPGKALNNLPKPCESLELIDSIPGTDADNVLKVWIHAKAKLPTEFGDFDVFAFRNNRDSNENLAIVRGYPFNSETPVPVRIHSECLTGDVFSSLRCDCRAQLQQAQKEIGASSGVIVYMRQEGRGIGLANKIAAYALQDKGLDTVDANLHLGFDDDLRTYDVSAKILQMLGVNRVILFTNNPRKVFGLRGNNVEVVEMRPIRAGKNPENESYLATKRDRSGHLL